MHRSNLGADVLIALVRDAASGVLTLHFASEKLQKLFFRVLRDDMPAASSGDDLAATIGFCMVYCQFKVERTLKAMTLEEAD